MCFEFASRDKNEILVISGPFESNPRIVRRERYVVVFTGLQLLQRIYSSFIETIVETQNVLTNAAVPLTVIALAKVRIITDTDEDAVAAVEIFGDKAVSEIRGVISSIIRGHQMSVMASMKAEEIYKSPIQFLEAVKNSASQDLANLGIEFKSYILKDIYDDNGYLVALDKLKYAGIMQKLRCRRAQENLDQVASQYASNYAQELSRIREERKLFWEKEMPLITEVHKDIETGIEKAQKEWGPKLQEIQTRRKEITIQSLVEMEKLQEESKQFDVIIEQRREELLRTVMEPANHLRRKLEEEARRNRDKIIEETQKMTENMILESERKAEMILRTAIKDVERIVAKAESLKKFSLITFLMLLRMQSESADPRMVPFFHWIIRIIETYRQDKKKLVQNDEEDIFTIEGERLFQKSDVQKLLKNSVENVSIC